MYIDTHTHLTDERYENAENIIKNFGNEGLDYVIGASFDLNSSIKTAEFASKYPSVYAAIGIHPQDAETYNNDIADILRKLSKHPKVVAIGEIGLDYHYDPHDKILQQKVFLQQLELAHELKLPAIFHLRDAAGDFNELLLQNKHLLAYGGVMHCYAQSAELVPFYLKMGLYISFAGTVTFKNARGLLDAVRATPLDRILT